MIKLLLKSCLILALITSLSKADQITTGNLLPNAGQGASSAQSVDNNIDKIGNSYNNFTSSNATNFSSEVEVTGTGTLSYSGTLLDITTGNDTTNQNKLDNGITLQGNTIVQNCEWANSSYACGNRGSGRDSYSTKIQILDSNNSLLSETNQIRNNDAGYGSTAFKYTDTLIFNNVGSNKLNYSKRDVCEMIKARTGCVVTYNDFDSDKDHRDYEVSYDKINKLGFDTSISLPISTNGIDNNGLKFAFHP